jgi:hypothetical protein
LACKIRYQDADGEHKVKVKRGFPTEREALKYEEKFLQDLMVDKEYLLKKVKELNTSEAPNFEVLAKIKFLGNIINNINNSKEI